MFPTMQQRSKLDNGKETAFKSPYKTYICVYTHRIFKIQYVKFHYGDD